MTKILTVHSRKGGVGKTTVAYELAHLLGAPLVDFEWDEGSASRVWGYRHEERTSVPLVEAFEKDRTPRPLKGHGKPDLVPGHPHLVYVEPSSEDVAAALKRWTGEWDREWVVVDTHPGWSAWSDGACAVSDVVVSPVPLRVKELEATAGMVAELADYPLVLVPNMVPRVPDAQSRAKLRQIVAGTPVRVGPPIPNVAAVGLRRKRMAMTAEPRPAKALQPVVDALASLADLVRSYPK
ncbi:ParA family protein [Kineococcus glutinatus]|uniref:Chromosome partitioning protein n=1 Tax=Kineococcus glutinatus TaxID=1070872 RepID=A0ABP9HIT3_9ACTN